MAATTIHLTTQPITGATLGHVILTICILVIIQIILHGSIGRVIERSVRRHREKPSVDDRKREETLGRIFHTASALVLWIIGVIIILTELHINLTGLLTGAGVIGIIIGVGAQNIIKDLLGGIFIITENQYRVGDFVSITGMGGVIVSGIVEDISIRVTKIRDQDGNLHIVSNGNTIAVSNGSFKFSQVNLDIHVSYATDVDKVAVIINEIGTSLADDEHWAKIIVEPIQFVRIESFDDTWVNLKAIGRVKPGAQWDVAGAFRKRLQAAFRKNSIAMSVPAFTVEDAKK